MRFNFCKFLVCSLLLSSVAFAEGSTSRNIPRSVSGGSAAADRLVLRDTSGKTDLSTARAALSAPAINQLEGTDRQPTKRSAANFVRRSFSGGSASADAIRINR